MPKKTISAKWEGLPEPFRDLLIADLPQALQDGVRSEGTRQAVSQNGQWSELIAKTFPKAGESKDPTFRTYTQLWAKAQAEQLEHFIATLPYRGATGHSEGDEYQIYQDLTLLLVDCYLTLSPSQLVALDVPQELEAEHGFAMERAFSRWLEKDQALEADGRDIDVDADTFWQCALRSLDKHEGASITLTVQGIPLPSEAMAFLVDLIKSDKIGKLTLQDCEIDDTGAATLASAISEALSFSELRLDRNFITERGLVEFRPLLTDSERFLIMSIVGNPIEDAVLSQLQSDMEESGFSLSSIEF